MQQGGVRAVAAPNGLWRAWRCFAARWASGGSPGQHQTPIVEALWKMRGGADGKASSNYPEGAPVQSAVSPKAPSESRTKITYGFASDEALREGYRNPWGAVRIGRLLEDLDALAGNVAYAHASDGDPKTRPLVLVTASVDRIRLTRPLALDRDLTLSGEVVYVGSSSMEIRMKVHQNSGAQESSGPSLQADFAFVARDPVTQRAARVNPLACETEDEKATATEVGERVGREKAQRKALQLDPGERVARRERVKRWAAPLVDRAQAVACGMPLARHGTAGDRPVVLLGETQTTNSFLCQSQQRNLGGRVFGGFIMRRGFELGFANCYAVCGARPRFVEVDQVDFHRPVDVGSLVRFSSRVLHVSSMNDGDGVARAVVEVVASVLKPEERTLLETNTLRLVFAFDSGETGLVLPEILPSNFEEAERIVNAVPHLLPSAES